jgi:hypothetical protein
MGASLPIVANLRWGREPPLTSCSRRVSPKEWASRGAAVGIARGSGPRKLPRTTGHRGIGRKLPRKAAWLTVRPFPQHEARTGRRGRLASRGRDWGVTMALSEAIVSESRKSARDPKSSATKPAKLAFAVDRRPVATLNHLILRLPPVRHSTDEVRRFRRHD